MSDEKLPASWTSIPIEDCLLPYPNGKRIRQGWSPQCEKFPAQTQDDWGVLKTSAIQDGYFLEEENKHLPSKLDPRTHLEVEPGDILITCAGPRSRCGVTCLVRATRPKLLISGKMYQLRADSEIVDRHLLELFLREPRTKQRIDELKTGINDSGLNLTHDRFKTLEVPLPPLAEQKRIVAKIEELFSELDAGEESLRRARRQLGVYRQSLLKQAFEGKLTAPWRLSARKRAQAGAQIGDVVPEARDGQWFAYIIECDSDSFYVGSTHDLRERWRRHCEGTGADWTKANPPRYLVHFETFASEAEARKRESDLKTGFGRTWRKREVKAGRIKPLVHNANNPATEPVRGEALQTGDQLLARIQSERQARYQQQLKEWEKAGGGRGKPKSPERIAPLADLKLALPRELPTGWTWIAVADVGRIETGTTPPTKEPKNYGGDTPFFKPTDLDQGVNVREAREHLSALGREAARILPAGTTLVTCIGATIGKTGLASVECATNQQINTISPEACFDSRFVYYATIAPNLNGLIKSEASATTLPILNKSKFEALPFPLCSLPEQQEIVRLLDGQFEVIEQNEREIDAALKRSEALRQSILKKAFTGQLVPQDPTDEPASALLVRIREEREASISSVRMRAR